MREDWPIDVEGFYGQITINNITYEVEVEFDMGVGVEFILIDSIIFIEHDGTYGQYIPQKARLFYADCIFSPNQIIMWVQKEKGGLLSEQIEKLIFQRIDKQPDTDLGFQLAHLELVP